MLKLETSFGKLEAYTSTNDISNISNDLDWHLRFFGVAKEVSSWSRDPSSKIGAVVVSPKNIILATGWNGFPRNIKDTYERLNDRETKYKYIVHAEMNCIYNACYTGNSLDKSSLYVYGLPTCAKCCLGVAQTGISKVHMMYKKNVADKWKEEFEFTRSVFDESGVEYNIFYCE